MWHAVTFWKSVFHQRNSIWSYLIRETVIRQIILKLCVKHTTSDRGNLELPNLQDCLSCCSASKTESVMPPPEFNWSVVWPFEKIICEKWKANYFYYKNFKQFKFHKLIFRVFVIISVTDSICCLYRVYFISEKNGLYIVFFHPLFDFFGKNLIIQRHQNWYCTLGHR